MTALDQKSCVITGAGSGVGRSACLLFAAAGAKVVCADIDESWAQATADEVLAAGGQAVAIRCDVTKRAEVRRAVSLAVERFGRLDVMYNNAGVGSAFVGQGKSFTDFTTEDVSTLMSINLIGVIYGCQAAISQFLRQGGGGAIVNTGSVAGMVGMGGPVYGASKGGVIQLTRSLAIEYASDGIRVNTVCPAAMITNFGQAEGGARIPEARPEATERYATIHPLGRAIAPEDTARAALFLASDAAGNITGVLLPVDGGYTAQ